MSGGKSPGLPPQMTPTVRIDSYAHANRWRQLHPGIKGLLVLCSLTAALLSHHPGIPLLIASCMCLLTIFGARIPWRGYLRLLLAPLIFLLWSTLLLPMTFSPGTAPLLELPAINLSIGLNSTEIPRALLVFTRSLAALCTLLFLSLTTPANEIAGLLRRVGVPRLLVELMMITYRQIFILLEAFTQIRRAQEARLGYRSLPVAWRSFAGMAGQVLVKTVAHARSSHQALLARGYDQELRFLSPQRSCSNWHLFGAGFIGISFILLAWQVQP